MLLENQLRSTTSEKEDIMKKTLLLFATILFTATQIMQAMHPSTFHIQSYDKTFQVKKKIIQQFKTFKENKEKEKIGTKTNPWNITEYVKKILHEDGKKETKKQIELVEKFIKIADGKLDLENINNGETLLTLLKLAEKLENDFLQQKIMEALFFVQVHDKIFPVNKKAMTQLEILKAQQRFENYQEKEIGTKANPWDITQYLETSTPRPQPKKTDKLKKKSNIEQYQIEVAKKMLEITSKILKPEKIENEMLLFHIIKLANLLANTPVENKCMAILMKPRLVTTIEAESLRPGLYPMRPDLFFFRTSWDEVQLYKLWQKKPFKTFKRDGSFLSVAPIDEKEFYSGGKEEVCLWKIKKPDKPIRRLLKPKKEDPFIIFGRGIFYSEIAPLPNNQFLLSVEHATGTSLFNNKNMELLQIIIKPKGLIRKASALPISTSTYIPEKKEFLTGTEDEINLYQWSDTHPYGKIIKQFNTKFSIFTTHIPETNFFLSSRSRGIDLWGLDQKDTKYKTYPIGKVKNPLAKVKTKTPRQIIAINKNSFCTRARKEKVIKLWKIKIEKKDTSEEIKLVPFENLEHPEIVHWMALMPDRKHLISYAGTRDSNEEPFKGKIYIWNIITYSSFEQIELALKDLEQKKEMSVDD